MDCLRAREIVSEAFDRGVANVPEAAEARDHCRTCPECRRFVEGLGMLQKIAPPLAPPYLVEDMVERARRMAEANVPPIVGRPRVPTEEQQETAEAVQPEPPAVEFPQMLAPAPRPRQWTAGRIAAMAAAVLVGVFALSASMQGFLALKGGGGVTPVSGPQAALESSDPAYSGEAKAGSTPSADRSLAASASSGTRYVSFEGQAYFWLGPRKPEGDTLVPAGRLTSSLEAQAMPEEHDVWRSKADADLIFVRGEDEESYIAFRRATRSRDGKVFALYTDELKAYGLWPALPSQYTTPTATDGSPTFSLAGKDDAGLDIYAPPGSDPSAGFAVAPNTTPGDPAAGNPNWTWWVPRP